MEKKICTVDGCEKTIYCKGVCRTHYYRLYKTGKTETKKQMVHSKICKIDGCNNPYYGKGYCSKHYNRIRRNGNALELKREYHGLTGTIEHNTWRRMIARCTYPSVERYPRYGGRGIKVCDRWLNFFIAFLEDMGKKPFPEAQLDRIDNDGNYEPSNCRWVTPSENCLNRSNSKKNIHI